MTRAQLLCAWAVASEAPTDAEFELAPPDNYGVALLSVHTDLGQRVYKLPREGGRELVTEDGVLAPTLNEPEPEE